MPAPGALVDVLRRAQHVVVLTGSGVSAESGVPTFRDAQTGIWQRFRPEELATLEAFRRNPERVWNWYAWRRKLVQEAEPNPAHIALAHLEHLIPKMTLITQNVDGLHQRAGSNSPLEFHGSILANRCSDENRRLDETGFLPGTPPVCKNCGAMVRPDVVWFGEAIDTHILHAAEAASVDCDVFLSVGTSSEVHPAAGLAMRALSTNAVVAELNPDRTPLSDIAHFCLRGPAGTVLPELVRAFKES